MSPRFAILCCSTAFLPAESDGGPPYSTFHLCRALIRAGADVRVITTDRNGAGRLSVPTDCWSTYDGVPVWYARTAAGPFQFGKSARAAVFDAASRVDCLINSGTLWVHLGWLAWRASRRYRKPSVSYLRGLLDPWALQFKAARKQAHWRLIGRRLLEDSAAIVALSDTERETIRALKITTRIEVIPNGAPVEIPTQAHRTDRASLEAQYPELSGRRYVVFLGRIHAKKGIDVLLPAIAAFRRSRNDVAFVIAGPIDPAYRSRWNEIVHEHRLEKALILPGVVSGAAKDAWLRHADLFVLPSYSEGLPVSVLEALGSGCPVVVSRACHLPEVQDAGAGLVIEPAVEPLLAAMQALLADDSRRLAMSERARVLAATTFDWDAIGRRTLDLCRDVSNGRQAVRQ